MKQTLYTFLLSYFFLILYVILYHLFREKQDEILYVLIMSFPQLFALLFAVIILNYLIISNRHLKNIKYISLKLIVNLALLILVLVPLLLFDELQDYSDFVFILLFFLNISISYHLVEKRLAN